jgi:hypothetical protein
VIVEKDPIDGLCDLPLESPQCFGAGLGFGESPMIMGLASVHGLDTSSQMQRVVELAVARSREPVAHHRTSGGFDRSRAGVTCEVVDALETGDVAGLADNLGSIR